MNFRFFVLLFALFSVLTFSGCQRTEQKTAASADAKRYDLTGKVVSVDQAKRKAKIEHDEIKGYMPAMTMDFQIKQDWVLRELKPGHQVGAELVVDKDDYWLENVTISAAPQALSNVSGVATEAPSDKIGQEVPDFKLTNQDGKPISFDQFRGKNLAVTFIFTRCPDANMCPLMSINFSDMAKELEKSPELAANTRLLSITFDPAYDTPETLKKYGSAYFGKDAKPNFEIWQLATGSEKEITDVMKFFGVQKMNDEGQRIVHNLRTVVISPEGKIYKMYAGNDWKTADILKDLQTLSAKQ
jgi:protein SCO1/2